MDLTVHRSAAQCQIITDTGYGSNAIIMVFATIKLGVASVTGDGLVMIVVANAAQFLLCITRSVLVLEPVILELEIVNAGVCILEQTVH